MHFTDVHWSVLQVAGQQEIVYVRISCCGILDLVGYNFIVCFIDAVNLGNPPTHIIKFSRELDNIVVHKDKWI